MDEIRIKAYGEDPRLSYVLDWIFVEQLKVRYVLEEVDIEYFSVGNGTRELSVYNHGLLFESGIYRDDVPIGRWNELPALFHSETGTEDIPFDIFSAIFFLLSRYEEYEESDDHPGSYRPPADKHGRYPATESILYKNGWLERPLVDEWLMAFREELRSKLGVEIEEPPFSFQCSYDIDIAWSYRNKGFARTIGATGKDIITGKMSSLKQRLNTASGGRDPYDAFDEMFHWHKEFHLKPDYFILAALETTDFDKNIHPDVPEMQDLIRRLSEDGNVGMHPSYFSTRYATDFATFNAEKQKLESIIGRAINTSRQHYLRMRLPETYRFLISQGIEEDHTMGYGSHVGFRAGTSRSFLWYDLNEQKVTKLRVHPFAFMDTTAHYDMKLSTEAAFAKLDELTETVRKCSGKLTTIFHNFSLGTDKEWTGWAAAYKAFLKKVS